MVVINSRFLTQDTTGVQRFAIEICKELKMMNVGFEFVAPQNIKKTSLADFLEVKKIGFLKGHLWEQITLQHYVWKKKALLISFCNTGPLFIRKQIITIHDLSFRFYPQWNSKIFAFFYNILIPIIARKSTHILTVSQTSKKELIKELKIEKNKIDVIYNAVSNVFNNDTLPKVNDQILNKEYILTVSSFHPRKNLQRLIDAFLKIPNEDLNLYIVGNFDRNFASQRINNIDKNSRIKILESVNDISLKYYYENARLFVYPSLYEGFGIPIIEALSCGVPVCVSKIDVFKEVCGNQAIYFDPFDEDDIKSKILEALEKPIQGSTGFKEYKWEKSANLVIEIIENHNNY